MESPRQREPSPDPSLGMLTGPKIFVQIQFHPSEFKPYFLDCILDSGCQVNLAKGSALPHFYWESTSYCGSAIQGTPVPLVAKSENFPIKLKGTSDTLTLYKLDDINEDCILGSEFLSRVSLISIDTKKMIFSCVINDCKIELPIFFNSAPKCQSLVQKYVHRPNPAQLLKMDCCIAFSDIHGEKSLANITAKLVKVCCSEIPNAFWKREKYLSPFPLIPSRK